MPQKHLWQMVIIPHKLCFRDQNEDKVILFIHISSEPNLSYANTRKLSNFSEIFLNIPETSRPIYY